MTFIDKLFWCIVADIVIMGYIGLIFIGLAYLARKYKEGLERLE